MTFFQPHVLKTIDKRDHRLPQCGRCGLFKQCNSPKMPPTGEGHRPILFVAEAPGKQEDEEGIQLVGKSGQLLRSILDDLGLDLEDCTKTNAVICRPPGNKIKDVHIESCRPNLLKTLRKTKPKVIVLLGGSAVRSLIPTEREASVGSVTRWVGWTIPSHEYQAWICPTYHPSYILREENPVLDRLFREHLKKAISLEDKTPHGIDPEELKKQVEIVTSPKAARLRLKELATRAGLLAFDYESNRIKPDHPNSRIYAVSFCLDGEETWATPFQDDPRFLRYLRRVLQNERLLKIASNIKNEERWSNAPAAKIEIPAVAGWFWDTMLAAHILDNRTGISSLKFQAFIHYGIADYDHVVSHYFEALDAEGFNRIADCPRDELLLYNGIDSLLEVKIAVKQRRKFGLSSP